MKNVNHKFSICKSLPKIVPNEVLISTMGEKLLPAAILELSRVPIQSMRHTLVMDSFRAFLDLHSLTFSIFVIISVL